MIFTKLKSRTSSFFSRQLDPWGLTGPRDACMRGRACLSLKLPDPLLQVYLTSISLPSHKPQAPNIKLHKHSVVCVLSKLFNVKRTTVHACVRACMRACVRVYATLPQRSVSQGGSKIHIQTQLLVKTDALIRQCFSTVTGTSIISVTLSLLYTSIVKHDVNKGSKDRYSSRFPFGRIHVLKSNGPNTFLQRPYGWEKEKS